MNVGEENFLKEVFFPLVNLYYSLVFCFIPRHRKIIFLANSLDFVRNILSII